MVSTLRKIKVKLDFLADIDTLLIVEKYQRQIGHDIYCYAKGNNKYMNDKNKESSHRKYWYINNLYGWKMSKKLPIKVFKLVEKTVQEDSDCIGRQ